ncbi:MAG: MaoC family dehydratase N-terminal domain-containing protein [Candidatus Binatia bacterium]
MTDSDGAALVERLRAHVGRAGQAERARDPVNQAMIRHWCDAMDDRNPVYTDAVVAAGSRHGQIVAPPAMLNAWTMPGNVPRVSLPDDPMASVLGALDVAGFTSVVATNSTHEYPRYLRLGDVLVGVQTVTDVSEQKQTALGTGHFVTTTTEYRTPAGELVGRMQFRILKFRPGTGRAAAPEGAPSGPRPVRPRPGISHDTRFFWDGVAAGELRIQRCRGCGTLHHPPRVRCHACGSYDLGHTVSSGRGVVYSFVEPCHPKVPAFDYPYVVGLIELEEGTRLLTNVVDVDPERVAVGMPVELVLRRPDPELVLPMFRPRRPPRREITRRRDEAPVGEELPPCPIDVTATLIVAGAIASRDYQDVHHDRELAVRRGSPDIFMNILTTAGLCGRYVSDWAGPEAVLRRLDIRLGVPNYPHDTMTMSGAVHRVEGDEVEVRLRGYNRLGDHVTGTVVLALPAGEVGR